MSKKKNNFFYVYKKQILIILGIASLVCLTLFLLFPRNASTPSGNIKTNRVKTEEQIQQCMNATYSNQLHPTRIACEKYDIGPDGSVIIDD